MGEMKSSNGKKNVVRTEHVSKLGNYTDNLELVGMDFSPRDHIYEKNESEGSNGAADETTGKKEADIGQDLYISAGNTVQFEFDPRVLEAQHLQKGLKGKDAKRSREEQQEQTGEEK